jgi:hypothetical protein
MEIHAPEGPIRTWTDILLHLGIVTIGILIALGLEQVVEWRHHRALAHEARETIRAELNENRGRVLGMLKAMAGAAKDQHAALEYLNQLLAHKGLKKESMTLRWQSIPLLRSAWATAQSLGALSFLPYDNVQKYADVYQLQDDFVRVQNAQIQKTVDAQRRLHRTRTHRQFPNRISRLPGIEWNR